MPCACAGAGTRNRSRVAAPRAPLRHRRTDRAFARDLHFLMTLSGEQHDVARPRFADRQARSPCGGPASIVYFAPGRCRPTSASLMMASGSSLRGLSEVSTTKSLPRPAASPISGRLARSRSPPQPNTVMTRPLPPARADEFAGQRGQIAQRIVGVSVVDDHCERLAAIDRSNRPGTRVREAMPLAIASGMHPRAYAAPAAARML